MEKIITNSKNLSRIKYLAELNTLEVEFKDGSVYHYFPVPLQVYIAAKAAESTSEYMNANIKGKFTYTKVKDKIGVVSPEAMIKQTTISGEAGSVTIKVNKDGDAAKLTKAPSTTISPVVVNNAAFAALKSEAAALASTCNAISIVDETTLALATQTLSKASGLVKAVEAKRKELKEPYLEAGKAIDSAAKSVTAELEVAIEKGRGSLKGWNEKVAAITAAAEEKVRKEWNLIKAMEDQVNGKIPSAATPEQCQSLIDSINTKWPSSSRFTTYAKESEDTKKMFIQALETKKTALTALLAGDTSAMSKVKEANETATSMVAQQAENAQGAEIKAAQAIAATPITSTAATRKQWKFEIVNADEVPRNLLVVDESLVRDLMKAEVAAGRVVDGTVVGGIRFYIDNVPVIR